MSLPKLLCHDGICNLSSAKCQLNKTLLEYFIQNEISRSGTDNQPPLNVPALTVVTPEINATNLISIEDNTVVKIDKKEVSADYFQSQLA